MSTVTEPGGRSVPPPEQQVELLSVPKQGTVTVRFLGPCVGILTHWPARRHNGRATPPIACGGPLACPNVVHRLSTCWKGYAPCEAWREEPMRRWFPFVLEITERLWELLHKETLRGQQWELFRVANERGNVEVSGRCLDLLDPRTLRTDVQIEPVVCRVYRTTQIEWGVQPVMPPRQFLKPSDGPPPPTAAPPMDPRKIVGSPEWEQDQAEAKAALKAALRTMKGGAK